MRNAGRLLNFRVGIVYKDIEWANALLDQICQEKEEYIEYRTKQSLSLKSGVKVTAVKAGSDMRCRRFDRIIVQEEIEHEDVYVINIDRYHQIIREGIDF